MCGLEKGEVLSKKGDLYFTHESFYFAYAKAAKTMAPALSAYCQSSALSHW